MKNFLKCGICGWCLELIWTGFLSFRKREMKLMGNSSLWMFPIYGAAGLIRPFHRLMERKNFVFRGAVYTFLIFLTEFFTGSWLKARDCCPWDYGDSRYNVGGVIRLDYAPLWFGVGLLFEKLTCAPKGSAR
ncbi:MAG: hypothetical protein Q4F41_12365 [Eubacteriales bacterium]|nr:hypothetical protein [Eubacteriales bacterium]